MDAKATQVYDYVMQRCLWQFFSRNWDREANIKNVMDNVARIISKEPVPMSTAAEKCHYADARILVDQLSEKYDWFAGLTPSEIISICKQVKEKLLYSTVTNSLNEERDVPFY